MQLSPEQSARYKFLKQLQSDGDVWVTMELEILEKLSELEVESCFDVPEEEAGFPHFMDGGMPLG